MSAPRFMCRGTETPQLFMFALFKMFSISLLLLLLFTFFFVFYYSTLRFLSVCLSNSGSFIPFLSLHYFNFLLHSYFQPKRQEEGKEGKMLHHFYL